MRREAVKPPQTEDAEATRGAGYERKQRWKEQPGNRYTPEELRKLSESLDSFTIDEQEIHIMQLD